MSIRKILFWIHLGTGCLAGIVVLILSVTGVLLAYQRQITSWMDRDSRSVPQTQKSLRLPMAQMLEQVSSQNRGAPSAITLRSDPTAPAEIAFGREHVFLVNVYTGAVLGESAPGTRVFFQKIENFHRWLGAGVEHRAFGRAVTGACNFGFLLLVVSGPFLWLPRRWSWQSVRSVLLFRGGLSGRARDFNWHNVIGIWCAVPLFVIVLSGVVMSYPWANNLLYRLTGNEPPVQGNGQRSETQATKKGERPTLSGLDALWLRAEQQVPGWRTLTLRLPANGRGPMAFTIDTGAGGRPDQRSQLTLDRRSDEITRWEPFSSYNSGRRLRSWFRFLHTGEAGGIGGETVAAIASAGAAMLVWTGLWLAVRRWLRWRRDGRSKPDRLGQGRVTTNRSTVQFFARLLVRLAIVAAIRKFQCTERSKYRFLATLVLRVVDTLAGVLGAMVCVRQAGFAVALPSSETALQRGTKRLRIGARNNGDGSISCWRPYSAFGPPARPWHEMERSHAPRIFISPTRSQDSSPT